MRSVLVLFSRNRVQVRWTIAFLLFAALPSQAQNAGPSLESVFKSLAAASTFEARVDRASREFLGQPYLPHGPLGEGEAGYYDQSPLSRTDGFDCTTYVETVTALADSNDVGSFSDTLRNIRYKNGVVAFQNRNHFFELDWRPNNIAAGFYTDVTQQVVPHAILAFARQHFSKRAWYEALPRTQVKLPNADPATLSQRLIELHREGRAFPDQDSILPYLPKANLLQVAQTVPTPAILNIVSRRGGRQTVTHQVLLLRVSGVLHIRQASSRPSKMRVIDSTLSEYSRYLSSNPLVLGVNILRIEPRGPVL